MPFGKVLRDEVGKQAGFSGTGHAHNVEMMAPGVVIEHHKLALMGADDERIVRLVGQYGIRGRAARCLGAGRAQPCACRSLRSSLLVVPLPE